MSGIVYALASALLFGASAPLAKMLLGGISPWLLAGILYLGSGVGLACVRFAWRGGETPRSPRCRSSLDGRGNSGRWRCRAGFDDAWTKRDLRVGSFIAAQSRRGFDTRHRMAGIQGVCRSALDIGAGAIVLGALILSWPSDMSFSGGFGSLCIAGACMAWAIDNNLTRKISGADPVQIAMIKGLSAGAVNIVLAIIGGAVLPDLRFIAGGAIVGFLGYGVSLTLFVLALRFLGTARTGAYFSLAPFIGAGIAISFLGEHPTPAFFAAAC